MHIIKRIIRRFRKLCLQAVSAFYTYNSKKIGITKLSKLSRDIPLPLTSELHEPNDFYFHALTLKKYCGLDKRYQLKCVIEHGFFFGGYYWDLDTKSTLPAIISFSEDRKELVEKVSDKKFYSIGPYIAYAKGILTDDQIEQEKTRLGKTLLFFPFHSSHWNEVSYNIQNTCDEIKQIAVNYKSVRICLYWKDILHGHHKTYKKNGFECVCAGHIYDEYFLPRLKSIIELSDIVMSNRIGTYLGYCIYMKKPFYFLKQEYNFLENKKFKDDTEIALKHYNENTFEYYKLFGKITNKITEKQYDFINQHWGLSCIKTKDELRKIFNECEMMYSENKTTKR
jgi:hypothetical protein